MTAIYKKHDCRCNVADASTKVYQVRQYGFLPTGWLNQPVSLKICPRDMVSCCWTHTVEQDGLTTCIKRPQPRLLLISLCNAMAGIKTIQDGPLRVRKNASPSPNHWPLQDLQRCSHPHLGEHGSYHSLPSLQGTYDDSEHRLKGADRPHRSSRGLDISYLNFTT
jgi:hypothetical protein